MGDVTNNIRSDDTTHLDNSQNNNDNDSNNGSGKWDFLNEQEFAENACIDQLFVVSEDDNTDPLEYLKDHFKNRNTDKVKL